jgi:putative chitinase
MIDQFEDIVEPPEVALAVEHCYNKYNITTPERMAAFLATVHHESNGFRQFTENLNYSPDRILQVWPTRFDPESAKRYCNRPQALANRVYANRMGNGSEATGDGWRYRGRGAIQITGFNNYKSMSRILDLELDILCEYMETTLGAIESAAAWWNTNGCNELADRQDMAAVTRKVNGGTTGLANRQFLYKYYMNRINKQSGKK